jgi:hypothetical protein
MARVERITGDDFDETVVIAGFNVAGRPWHSR